MQQVLALRTFLSAVILLKYCAVVLKNSKTAQERVRLFMILGSAMDYGTMRQANQCFLQI